MPASKNPMGAGFGPPGEDPSIGKYIALGFLILIELAMATVLFGTYSETMGYASDLYLCDLPGPGRLFCHIDEDMTVTHLLAFLLAIFSIAVPMAIFNEAFRQGVFDDPQGWWARPTNRVYAGIALGVFALVFALETVNIYTLIAQQSMSSVFASTAQTSALMDLLANNQGLGVFIAALVAVVNAVLGLLTVRAARALNPSH